MAGHSKWNNIKHRKGAADAKRGKVFSKLAKLIMIAARSGGANPSENLRLRYAIDRARAESMPKDSIDRAIKKGSGELEAEEVAELTYEGILTGGLSVIIEAMTDNRNRTGGEIRNLLEKRGGSLSKANSVLWKFDRRGILGVDAGEATEDELFDVAIEAGADNIEAETEVDSNGDEKDVFHVFCRIEDFDTVRAKLQEHLLQKRGDGEKKWGEADDERPLFTRSEFVYLPQNPVALEKETTKKALDLIADLEDHDDVQNVFSDIEISDDLLNELAAI